MAGQRIVEFSADPKADLLVILVENPTRKVIIESAEARKLYDKPVGKKPGYAVNEDNSEGWFTMQMADGAVYSWTAEVGVSNSDGDILLYNLKRIEQQ